MAPKTKKWRGPWRWVLACVLLGSSANILITWSLALWMTQARPGGTTARARLSDDLVHWRLWRVDHPGMTRLYWQVGVVEIVGNYRVFPVDTVPRANISWSSGPRRTNLMPVDPDLVPAWSEVRRRPPDPQGNDDTLLLEVGWGWPWTSASYEYVRQGSSWFDPRSPVRGAIDLGNRIILGRREVRALPLRPAWGGIMANTAVLAASLAGLVFIGRTASPWLFAQRYRRRGGLCVKCGYNLSGAASGRCPECGTSIEK